MLCLEDTLHVAAYGDDPQPATVPYVAEHLVKSGPGAELWEPELGIIVLPQSVKNDDDPLLNDSRFTYHAKRRPGKDYPELPRHSLPSAYANDDTPLGYWEGHVRRVGQDARNRRTGEIVGANFEIDLIGEGHDKGATAAQILLVIAALALLGYIEVRRSTRAGGLHLRVRLKTPIASTDPRDYSATINHVVDIIDHDLKKLDALPFTLRSVLDPAVLGRGVLFVWGDDTNERSFELLSAAAEPLDLGNWRPNHEKPTPPIPRGQGFDLLGALKRNNISFTTKPYERADDGIAYRVTCPKGPHDGGSDVLLFVVNGVPRARCLAEKCKLMDYRKFAALVMGDDPNATLSASSSVVITVVHHATKEDEFFHDKAETTYVVVRINGQLETLELDDDLYALKLRDRYRKETGSSITDAQLKQAIKELHAHARLHSPRREVARRIAKHNDKFYLDLCDEGRNVVEIDKTGWRVKPSSEVDVRFMRPSKFLPISTPLRHGDANLLWKYLNINVEDRPLVWGWLLAALRTDLAVPLLLLTGQAGSGKTTTFQFLAALISPLANDEGKLFTLSRMPGSEQDLFVAAKNGHIYAIDNVSVLNKAMSDALCALITGAADEGRKLFTNAGEHRITVRRPPAITAVGQVVTETDLQDRTLFVDLPQLVDRNSDANLWAKFDTERAAILGALLDAFVSGLNGGGDIPGGEVPRMVDFAQFATAAENAAGFGPGATVKAMNRAQRTLAEGTVAGSKLATAIIGLVSAEQFKGTASELMMVLGTGDWPANAQKFAGAFTEVIPALNKIGVAVEKGRTGGRTTWTISR